jgi:glycerol-3-phosphate dehydrogenase (NAD(P)+)
MKLKPHLRPGIPVANAAKGFELSTGLPLSAVLAEVFDHGNPVAALSGPNHAEEVGRGLPAATVVAAEDEAVAELFQDALMTPAFRVYTSTDILGVELGGALKNIIALAAGITDGLGYGDNTKAALMTRGMTEIVRLGVSMGARRSTFAGLSGMGDLIATCTSPHSRNRRAGLAIGQGKTLEEIVGGTNMVIEGVNATRGAYALSRKLSVKMPITEALYAVLFEGMDPSKAVASLMSRSPKSEHGEDLAFTEA